MGVKTHLAASSERGKNIFDFTHNRLPVPGFRIQGLIPLFFFFLVRFSLLQIASLCWQEKPDRKATSKVVCGESQEGLINERHNLHV